MPTDALDATFAALADPTRRAILARLAPGEASVNELAEPFEMTLPGVSKHLKVLERAGLISRSRVAQPRPCRHGLVDEITLLTFPVVVGQGRRPFPDAGRDTALELVESGATASGVLIQVYRTAGRPRYG